MTILRTARLATGLALVLLTAGCGARGSDDAPARAARPVMQDTVAPSPTALPVDSASVPSAPVEATPATTTVPLPIPVVTPAQPIAPDLGDIDRELAEIDSEVDRADLNGPAEEGDF